MLTVVTIVLAQYYSWFRQRSESGRLQERERPLVRCYLYGPAILIAVLMRFELGRSLVAAGWALLALVLIACGQRWKNARLIGLGALFLVLLTIVLFHEVSGALLTVAWGGEGVALLIAGFPLRDRTLRLSGLALFLVCILKLFLYDLRYLETLPRILSFIVLGLILVSVSWFYTRFRDQLQRYL